jgi:hypothetical protein
MLNGNALKRLGVAVTLLMAVVGLVSLPALLFVAAPEPAQAERPMTTTRHHSFCLTATGVSQTQATETMQRMVSGAVIFWNRDDADTVYININNDAVPAAVGCDDVVIVPPGMFVRHEVYRMKKFKYISDGTAEFYTSIDLWEN